MREAAITRYPNENLQTFIEFISDGMFKKCFFHVEFGQSMWMDPWIFDHSNERLRVKFSCDIYCCCAVIQTLESIDGILQWDHSSRKWLSRGLVWCCLLIQYSLRVWLTGDQCTITLGHVDEILRCVNQAYRLSRTFLRFALLWDTTECDCSLKWKFWAELNSLNSGPLFTGF